MAINPYSTPAKQNIKNTYVPVPFDDLYNLTEKVEARREEAETDMEGVYDDILDVHYIPNSVDADKVRDLSQQARDLIAEYSDPAKHDLSDVNTFNEVKRRLATIGNDPVLDMAQKSYDGWEKDQPTIRQLKARNEHHPALSNTGEGWDSAQQGVYDFQTTGLKDRTAYTYRIMDVQPIVNFDPNTGVSYKIVNDEMLEQRAKEQAPGFARSGLGQAWVKAWIADNGNPNSLSADEIAYKMLLEDGQHWKRSEYAPPSAGWLKGQGTTGLEGLVYNEGLDWMSGNKETGDHIPKALDLQKDNKGGYYQTVGKEDIIDYGEKSGLTLETQQAISQQAPWTQAKNRARSQGVEMLTYDIDATSGDFTKDASGAYVQKQDFILGNAQSDFAYNLTGFPAIRSDEFLRTSANYPSNKTAYNAIQEQVFKNAYKNNKNITKDDVIGTAQTSKRIPGTDLPLLYTRGNYDITSPEFIETNTHTNSSGQKGYYQANRYPGNVRAQVNAIMAERGDDAFKDGYMLIEGGYYQNGKENRGNINKATGLPELSPTATALEASGITPDRAISSKQAATLAKYNIEADEIARETLNSTNIDITDPKVATDLQKQQADDMKKLGDHGMGQTFSALMEALSSQPTSIQYPSAGVIKRNVDGSAYMDVTLTVPYTAMKQAFKSIDAWGDEDDLTGSPWTSEWQEDLVYGADNDQTAFMTRYEQIDKNGNAVEMISFPLKKKINLTRQLMHSLNKNTYATNKDYIHSKDFHNKQFDAQEFVQQTMTDAGGSAYKAIEKIDKRVNDYADSFVNDPNISDANKKYLLGKLKNIENLPQQRKIIAYFGFINELQYGDQANQYYLWMQQRPELFIPN